MSAQRKPSWLEGYVGVDDAVREFRDKYPDARILTHIVEGYDKLTFRAEIYLPDNQTNLPNSTGHASVDGGSTSGNRSHSPVEKTEAAAIRRALKWLGYGGKENEDEPSSSMTPVRAVAETFDNPELEEHDDLDSRIRQMFVTKGHTIDQLRPMINKRYEVTDGLNSLSLPDKRELLEKLRSS